VWWSVSCCGDEEDIDDVSKGGVVVVVVSRRGGKGGGEEKQRLEVRICKMCHQQVVPGGHTLHSTTEATHRTYAQAMGSDFINKAGIRSGVMRFNFIQKWSNQINQLGNCLILFNLI